MAHEEKKKSGGCLSRLSGLLVLAILAGLGTALYRISQPQDLSDIGGVAPAQSSGVSPARDIKAVLSKSLEGDYSVQLSETEINRWLARELKAKQGGVLGEWVALKGVYVRLREKIAEVIIEREIAGRSFTCSMFVQIEQTESGSGVATRVLLHGGGFHEQVQKPTRGGRFGNLTVPQGFLILVMEDYKKLAALFDEEIGLGFEQMSRIRIENKRITLDPRVPTRTETSAEETF